MFARTVILYLIGPLVFFSSCTETEGPVATVEHATEVAVTEPDSYYVAVEVTTDGARGVLLAVEETAAGSYHYESRLNERHTLRGADYPADGALTEPELAQLFGHLDSLLLLLNAGGEEIADRYFVTSPEYESSGLGRLLRDTVASRYPGYHVAANTPALEAQANFLTMSGRTDLNLDNLILVDVGSASTLFATYDSQSDSVGQVTNLPSGTRSTLLEIDPLGELLLSRENQRRRIERLVQDRIELDIKQLLRSPPFASRDKVVFMGGLVYKIVRTLEVPLNGRTIDFSRASEQELAAKFRALLLSEDPDLSRGPSYTAEELYASLTILETVMDEIGDQQSAYFFERPTWLPGYVLGKLAAAKK